MTDLPRSAQAPAAALALYLDCGTEDEHRFQDQAEYLDELLTGRRIDHTLVLGPGHHNYDFWVARLPASLAFLREHTAAAR